MSVNVYFIMVTITLYLYYASEMGHQFIRIYLHRLSSASPSSNFGAGMSEGCIIIRFT